jgi:2-phosphoglycerate kinase
MQRSDVEIIFELKKNDLTRNTQPSSNPVAILLGGQPASGKSNLAVVAEEEYKDETFLIINGDEYRIYHPEHDRLTKEVALYSENTQIFSNVFTEKLIEEAIKNRFSVIVEGTMRNPDVPLKTATMFKKAGYKVEAYIIAAPEQFTKEGIHTRYLQELKNKGFGRMADVRLHDEAVTGLLKSIDTLFQKKAVDRISIHTFMARKRVKEFVLKNNEWGCSLLPGNVIETARNEQT